MRYFLAVNQRRLRKGLVIGALVCLVGSSRVAAQVPITPTAPGGSMPTIDDVRKNYRIHVGPFYVNPGLLLKELGVDTNVFNEQAEQESDFMFTLAPQADVAIPFSHRGLVRTTLGTDLVYYHTFSSERSIDPQISARGELYANRLTLFLQESYINTRQRPNYDIDVRTRHLQNDFSGGARYRLTPKFSLEVEGHRGQTRFDGDTVVLGESLQESLDRDTTGFSVTARQRLSALTTLSARYQDFHEDFVYANERDSDSLRFMIGAEFKPRALINGSAFVGYRTFRPRTPLIPEYTGLASQLALSYTLLGSTTFGVSFDRDVTYSYQIENPYFLDNSVGVFVRRAIAGRYDVIVNAARHLYDYRNLGVRPEFLARTDTTNNYGANVGYRIKRQTRMGLGVSYYTRTSTTATYRDFDGLRIGMTVNYGF
jgi:hypothetical protein